MYIPSPWVSFFLCILLRFKLRLRFRPWKDSRLGTRLGALGGDIGRSVIPSVEMYASWNGTCEGGEPMLCKKISGSGM